MSYSLLPGRNRKIRAKFSLPDEFRKAPSQARNVSRAKQKARASLGDKFAIAPDC